MSRAQLTTSPKDAVIVELLVTSILTILGSLVLCVSLRVRPPRVIH